MQIPPRNTPVPPVASAAPLVKLDVETIRVAHERTCAERVRRHPLFATLASRHVLADAGSAAWAAVSDDGLSRRALIQLAQRGTLSEDELTSLVGGPRHARAFAQELEIWRPQLPFQIEIRESAGARVFHTA